MAPIIKWLRRDTNRLPSYTLAGTDNMYRAACASLGVSYPDMWIPPKVNACVHYYEDTGGNTVCIVALNVAKWLHLDQAQVLAILVHEASHVVDEHFEHMGERSPASEQRAYALQYVAEELFRDYRRQKEALIKRA